ncbi:hypothetical protein B0H17DRAFT_1070363 [Mycena rosella]|uniref:Uncharacterized protein n=1 Tax=Mycena rosella TaxID=1033263 RepID=A0AAD7DBD9_MYCRO|nr:hypothetical protein B0H17DRAFT_1070363 [Mycena rosella]
MSVFARARCRRRVARVDALPGSSSAYTYPFLPPVCSAPTFPFHPAASTPLASLPFPLFS